MAPYTLVISPQKGIIYTTDSYLKCVLTVALGFDTFVVMRHGSGENGLGCYFCNDVVSPKNVSLSIASLTSSPPKIELLISNAP
jgi:hypothetical protein